MARPPHPQQPGKPIEKQPSDLQHRFYFWTTSDLDDFKKAKKEESKSDCHCDRRHTTTHHPMNSTLSLAPTYPVRHGVSLWFPVMEVEDHDGGHHAAGHHEHDAVEVGS